MAKTVEEIYQKKTPKEHILLRPDTYIGSVVRDTQTMYVWDDSESKIVSRNISFVPGMYKIFDEILVNAADNKIRDPKMSIIAVEIDSTNGTISVLNNGKGIPIEMHNKEGVYVPELIFGHLLTSSNYDDNEKKVTGGRNGYGAKLCNIFSRRFTVETADGKRSYKQTFRNNMDITEEPSIGRLERGSGPFESKSFTKITFEPDLERFQMDELDAETVSLLKRRVYDLCGTVSGVAVYLNGTRIPIGSFKEYVRLYVANDAKVIYQRAGPRWEVALALSDDQFKQVSFVNSIATSKGGTHIAHVLDRVVEPLAEGVKKKEKGLDVKPLHVKSSLFLFVNCLVENPSFDSQTKENLTLRAQSFGEACGHLDGLVKEALKTSELVERITSFSRARQSAQLKKTDGSKTSRLTGIPKLEDANFAGTRRSSECTLILTEGDSAKTLAVAGLSVVGRDSYGVFPLRGKLLNVREASHQQIMANAEISSIKRILGLQHGKEYDSAALLRYGHVMIMTDQDHDGSHIKGLIINFLDHFYPSLLRLPGFLQEFITPIIRATRRNEVRDFFTIPEYEVFAKECGTGWTVKYYKGLGTSTSRDAKQYFSDLPRHVKSFVPSTDADRALVDLAFNKKKADLRKDWLAEFVPGTYLDHSPSHIAISDFINRELILFSMADNVRSIPSMVDGLKPGQRKVLFCCFKRRLTGEIKVAQLVGYVSEQSAYHHGEASLCATIVNMAHDFVGSNNLNLLLPIGSFGSRLQGGKDAASPRYIFTSLNPLTRLLFPEADDPVLDYLVEENMRIEPSYYVPIIPMVLVNGADGIGTGWSTSIPNYDPLSIIENIRCHLSGKPMRDMVPYYRHFRGSIERTEARTNRRTAQTDGTIQPEQPDNRVRFTVSGISTDTADGSVRITELPIGTWTQTYKEYVESLVQSGAVRDYREYHTEKSVDFLISPLKSFPLKIDTTISTGNMICFDPSGKLKKYASPLDIIHEFCAVRLDCYERRKQHHLETLRMELLRLANRVRFVREVVAGSLVISRRAISELLAELAAKKYEPLDNFEYLLGMKISSLTREKIERLEAEHAEKKKEYEILLGRTPENLWEEDLARFEKAYREMVCEEQAEYDEEIKKKEGTKKMKRRTTAQTKPKKQTTTLKKFIKNETQARTKKVKRESEMIVDSSSSEGPWSKYKV